MIFYKENMQKLQIPRFIIKKKKNLSFFSTSDSATASGSLNATSR